MTAEQFTTTNESLVQASALPSIKTLLNKVVSIITKAKPTVKQLIEAYFLTVEYVKALQAIFPKPPTEKPVPQKDGQVVAVK